jgi:hypothetical protein
MPKRIVPLSDLQVSKAKPGGKEYKLFDGGGLFLLVTPIYRWNPNDRGRNAPFGAPPAQIPAGAIHALGSHLGCLTSKRASGQG